MVDLKTSNILFWCNHATVCLKYEGHLFTALFKCVNGTTCYFHKMWWKYEIRGSKVNINIYRDAVHHLKWRIHFISLVIWCKIMLSVRIHNWLIANIKKKKFANSAFQSQKMCVKLDNTISQHKWVLESTESSLLDVWLIVKTDIHCFGKRLFKQTVSWDTLQTPDRVTV